MKSIDNIALIGSGSAASFFGKLFTDSGKNINFIYSRNPETACELAEDLGSFYNENPVFDAVDLVLICVKDDEIENVSKLINSSFSGIVCHCAGGVELNILKQFNKHGVFYPLQSLKGDVDSKQVPFLLEGSSETVENELMALANTCGLNSRKADSKTRFQYHLSAVFVNNFTNAMLAAAELQLNKHHLDIQLLYPLIRKTYENILLGNSPLQVQTGPAKRSDFQVMEKHLEMLKDNESLVELYKAVSTFIKINT